MAGRLQPRKCHGIGTDLGGNVVRQPSNAQVTQDQDVTRGETLHGPIGPVRQGEIGPGWQAIRAVALAYHTSREEPIRQVTFEPARPLDTDGMPWIPTGPGKSFRPLRFAADGWSELMRSEPGSTVLQHRHTGEVHAFNLTGTREIFSTGERVGPGDYVYEPAGTVDGWGAIGDEPCVVHIKVVDATPRT